MAGLPLHMQCTATDLVTFCFWGGGFSFGQRGVGEKPNIFLSGALHGGWKRGAGGGKGIPMLVLQKWGQR